MTYSRNSRRPSRATTRWAELRVRRRDDRRRRQSPRDLEREVGPGQRGHALGRDGSAGISDHLAHPQQGAGLEALDHGDEVRRWPAECGDKGADRRPEVPRRRREDHEVGRRRRGPPDRRSATTPLRQVDPGQAALVPPGPRDLVRDLPRSGRASVTGSVPAISRASVVPQAPAPTTATRGAAISAPCVAARSSRSASRRAPGARRAPRAVDTGAIAACGAGA